MEKFIYNKFLFLNLNFSLFNIFVYILFALILAVSVYGYLKLPKRRFLLISIRTIIILSLVFIFLEPSVEYVKYNKTKKNIIVLKDNSESLKLPLKSETKKADNLNYFFETNADYLKTLKNEYELSFYSFGKELNTVSEDFKITSEEKETGLIRALTELLKNYSTDEISSIIIASDFIDTDKKLSSDDYVFKKLESQKIPLNFITPDDFSGKDIYIKNIYYDTYAFVQNTTSIDLEISAKGYKNITKKVFLYRNKKLIDIKTVNIQENKTQKISFKFKPQIVGSYIYSVVIPPEKDEDLNINNKKDIIMNIIRDKIRVVQVVGKPSWDVRFMRQLLKNHPDIDLVSFFILRTTNDVYLVPEKELSLIPFPSHELFYEKLNTFDLIILQNFNYAPYGISPYLRNIRDFVLKRGGGLVMIGGLNSFNAGGYKNTPIEEVLPVSLPDIPIKESICYKNSHYNITRAGLESPFFKFAENYNKKSSVLKSLPMAEGFNKTILKKDATLIAQTDKVCDNKRYPLIATMEIGNGRSMVITTDNQWTWNFHALMDMAHKQVYGYFWDKAIKWLIKDPDMKLIKITLDNDIISTQEPLSVLIKAYDNHYKPLKNSKLYYSITNIDNSKTVVKKEARLDSAGMTQINENILKNGRYKIEFKTYQRGKLLETNYKMFIVKNKSKEFDNPQTDPKILNELSLKNNINIIKYDDSARKLKIKRQLSKIVEKKYVRIWDNVYMLILLISLFLLEIYIKRYRI